MFIEYYFLLKYFGFFYLKYCKSRPTETEDGARGMMSPYPLNRKGQCVGKGRRGRNLVVVLISLFFHRKVSHHTARSSLVRRPLTYFDFLNSIQQQNLLKLSRAARPRIFGCQFRESLLGLNITSCGIQNGSLNCLRWSLNIQSHWSEVQLFTLVSKLKIKAKTPSSARQLYLSLAFRRFRLAE